MMLSRALAFCGRHGRWVLPMGLIAGIALPGAAEPMRAAIPWCIGALLFLAVLRIFPDSAAMTSALSARQWFDTGKLVVGTQVLLPVLVFFVGSALGVPALWLLAATLVSAAPPISGSPNLVLLLRGDGQLAMRWLMLGTAVLPLTCLPILLLLFPAQSISIMLRPSMVLLVLIVGSVLLALLVLRFSSSRRISSGTETLDGLSAIVLALMVIGLMSAVHHPDTGPGDIAGMLVLAIVVNTGLQCLGVVVSKVLNRHRNMREALPAKLNTETTPDASAGGRNRPHHERTIAYGVVMGNRNIALYLTALPAVQMEPLLLFIACYQVPMYLTPLIGDVLYRRLE